jgi:hypothetical protein
MPRSGADELRGSARMEARMASVPPAQVDHFGRVIAERLTACLSDNLIGVYFVGSVALGGYIQGESDLDIIAVCERRLTQIERFEVAETIADSASRCPTRGLEFTLYRREMVEHATADAGFEVNANGGPRMDRLTRVSPEGQPGFWYALDRAIAHRYGIAITGPPSATVFADLPREMLLEAMKSSMRWHRTHEHATLYSVLNAARAWRFAAENVLGSKLDGAEWARLRWSNPQVIDAAVALRHGGPGELDVAAVADLLDHVEEQLTEGRSVTDPRL